MFHVHFKQVTVTYRHPLLTQLSEHSSLCKFPLLIRANKKIKIKIYITALNSLV